MKVTATITSANQRDRWSATFPTVDADACFPILDGKATAQPDECFRALASSPMIQGADYRENYLNCIVAAWIRLVNSWKDENCIAPSADGISDTLRRIERRTELGKVTHVRAVWHRRSDGHPTLVISISNDGIVQRNEYERLFAWKMAEAAAMVNEDLEERGLPTIAFDASVTALVSELEGWRRERDNERETKRMNEERFVCPNHRNGYCSPAKTDCPCYCNGRCEEAKA